MREVNFHEDEAANYVRRLKLYHPPVRPHSWEPKDLTDGVPLPLSMETEHPEPSPKGANRHEGRVFSDVDSQDHSACLDRSC